MKCDAKILNKYFQNSSLISKSINFPCKAEIKEVFIDAIDSEQFLTIDVGQKDAILKFTTSLRDKIERNYFNLCVNYEKENRIFESWTVHGHKSATAFTTNSLDERL